MLKIVEQGPVGQKYPRLFCYLSEKNSSEKIVSFFEKRKNLHRIGQNKQCGVYQPFKFT